jgi:hypothetical protein
MAIDQESRNCRVVKDDDVLCSNSETAYFHTATMAELLETALGKRKAGAAGLDDDSMSDDSPASDKQPALASPEESSDAPEQSEAPDASLPTCLQAIQQPCWRNPQTRKLVCLLCPDRPLSHKLGDPWRFHSATNVRIPGLPDPTSA